MDFIDKIEELARRIPGLADIIRGNEAATKNSLIEPFIRALGYDTSDPREVQPEYTADVGTKKGEKVDYAILRDGKPIILIECKAHGANLSDQDEDVSRYASQLYRYFTVSRARFGILTNGVEYRFFSDIERANIMDQKPFLVFDVTQMSEAVAAELKKFAKSVYNEEVILSTASELKYTREIKRIMAAQLNEPDGNFVKFFARQVYAGNMTQSVVEMFTPITQQALNEYFEDEVQARLRSALSKPKSSSAQETADEAKEVENIDEVESKRQIDTTAEEMEGFYIVRAIVAKIVSPERIVMRDVQSYCGILLDDNNRRTICRLHFNRSQKYVSLFDKPEGEDRVAIDNVADIYQYADRLIATAQKYEQPE